MKRFFDPCRRQRQSLSLLAAGALPKAEKDQIESHLAACAHCRKYFEEIKAVTTPLANWADDLAQLQPSESVRTRWSKAIMAAGQPVGVRRLTPAMAFHGWWQDVIWPRRRVWAGLAAVWVMILAGNFSLRESSPVITAKSALPTQEAVASFRDQQKILAELLPDNSAPRDAERPKLFSPKPRTQIEHILTA